MRVKLNVHLLMGMIALGSFACSTTTEPDAVKEPTYYVQVFLNNGQSENFQLDNFMFALQDQLEITDADCVVHTIMTEEMTEVVFFGQTRSPCSGGFRWEFQVITNSSEVRGHDETFSDYVQVRGLDFNTGYEKFINFASIERVVFNRE